MYISYLYNVLKISSIMKCCLSHWGRVTHTCVGNLTITGSDNGLSPGWCQAIIWTNTGILLIGPLRTNFSENSIKILKFSFKKNTLASVVCETIFSWSQWVKTVSCICWCYAMWERRLEPITIPSYFFRWGMSPVDFCLNYYCGTTTNSSCRQRPCQIT